jgi:hypothetical protein
VPQEICHRWESNGSGRYQRSKDGDCQYKGVLVGGYPRALTQPCSELGFSGDKIYAYARVVCIITPLGWVNFKVLVGLGSHACIKL